jgi:UDP-glucose 4-epimerase
MKILVTGGAGFIGSHIVDALIKEGHDAVVVDNLSTGKAENIDKKAKFYKADLQDSNLDKIFKKERPQIVNHQAAQKNVRLSVENPIFYLRSNGLGTLNLLENCIKYNVKKIVFASTGGAIYDSSILPVKEGSKLNPLSPYGITKLLGELYLKFYNETYGLKYVSLRYGNVYGPRQDAEGEAGVAAIFSNLMLQNKAISIFGDGKQTRDFVYVGDVVKANLLAMENPKADNQAFNIATCKETSINGLFNLLKSLTAYESQAIHTKPKKGEVRRMYLSCEKAFQFFGWNPSISLEEGLHNTIAWFKRK